jgi:tetraacyldisaccharide 4'-kinase
VRLPDSFRMKVLTLPVRLQLVDWTPVDDAFAQLGL